MFNKSTIFGAMFVATITTASSSQTVDFRFPDLVEEYNSMSSLQKDHLEISVIGASLSGSGAISEIDECGFMDAQYGCFSGLKIVLEVGDSKAIIIFAADQVDQLLSLKVGAQFQFENCEITAIKEWGFWRSVSCVSEP